MNQTPKEKAKELKDKFSVHLRFFDEYSGWVDYNDSSHAKQFALVAVDEIIKATTPLTSTYFWQEVKEEIENL
jgi:hypothetical protein